MQMITSKLLRYILQIKKQWEIFHNKSVNSHKHLGLILDEKLIFENHLNDKLVKANKGVGVIKALFHTLPRKALLNIYTPIIRPQLDYCDIIYHKPTSDELSILDYEYNTCHNKRFNDMIESIQYNAALVITGCIRGTSREKICNELWIMSLYGRRNYRRLAFFYKIKNVTYLPKVAYSRWSCTDKLQSS